MTTDGEGESGRATQRGRGRERESIANPFNSEYGVGSENDVLSDAGGGRGAVVVVREEETKGTRRIKGKL